MTATMCTVRFNTSLALAKRLWRVFWPVAGEEVRQVLLILETTPCLAIFAQPPKM